MKQSNMSFVVHPWLCDAMGHLSARYFAAFFDDAAYRLFVDIDGTPRAMQQRGLGWADVKHTIEYRHEVTQGAILCAYSRVLRIGNKSIDHFHELVEVESRTTCATMTAVTARMSLSERHAVQISDDVRRRAESLMNDHLLDEIGWNFAGG
jgi:acyl-CoA thioester hydrolase